MVRAALLCMLTTQALVVAAALAPAALGPLMTAELRAAPEAIGYYASLVFASALAAAQGAPRLIGSVGPVRASQAALVAAAIGLLLASTGTWLGVAASALLIGAAYAPGNPASSLLLARVVPAERRAFIFSLKQTAVPIGGVIAGIGAPALAGGLDWRGALVALAGAALVVAAAVQPWRAAFDADRPAASAPGRGPGPLALVRREPALTRMAVVSFSLASVQFSFSPIIIAYLAAESGASLAAAGLVLTGAMAVSVALRIGLGAIADRAGGGRVLRAAAASMAAAAGLSALLAVLGGAPFAAAALLGVLLGAGAFSWNGVFLSEVARVAPPHAIAAATAGSMTFVFLGGVVGPALAALLVSIGGYVAGFAGMALLALAAAAALSGEERP